MRPSLCTFLALALIACPGQDQAAKRMKEKLKAEEARKAEQKKKDEDADAKRFAPAPADTIKLGTPYDDSESSVISDDGPCPEGLWAMFKGDPPGADKAEKKANEAKREGLVKDLKAKQFLVKLRAPDQVKLQPFDAPKGLFPLEVSGKIDCTDSIGHVAIAWTAAKAGNPGNSAAKEGSDVTQNEWIAPPVAFTIPMKTMVEAKQWSNDNRIGLKARVVFKLGKTEVDRKMRKIEKAVEKVQGETISLGGGNEDWGAGRLVRVELIGLRVASNKEKDQIFEKRGDGK